MQKCDNLEIYKRNILHPLAIQPRRQSFDKIDTISKLTRVDMVRIIGGHFKNEMKITLE